MTIKEFKIKSKNITNLNPNTIRLFLNNNIDIKDFIINIFNSNPKKYCSINKTFIALYTDLKFNICKKCGQELTYDQTFNHAQYCSNKCKLSITENPFSKKDIQEKIKQTNLKRYGSKNPMFNENIKQKIKNTNLKQYGVINTFQRTDIKEKIKQTNLKRYGVKYTFQNKNLVNKFKISRKKSAYLNFKKLCEDNEFTLLCDLEHYQGTNNIYQLVCKKCGNIFSIRYDDGKLLSRCFVCEPRKNPPIRSQKEIDVYNYIKTIYKDQIITNDRIIIGPLEIDIYLPKLNLGIEFDGTYWHSLKPDNYHQYKDQRALEKEITIIHIKEEDWDNNKDKIKQYLKEIIDNYNFL